MSKKNVTTRSRVAANWNPSTDGVAYAKDREVDIDEETESFRDYHLAHGSLMLDWDAAWRTWVRNSIKYNRRKPAGLPLMAAADANDPWGVQAWIHTLRDTSIETNRGLTVVCVNGWDIKKTAEMACEAAGIPSGTRVDLEPVAEWCRLDIPGDLIVEVITSSSRRPDRPSLRYYHNRIVDRGTKAR